jgi:protoporphyrinogen oxidase
MGRGSRVKSGDNQANKPDSKVDELPPRQPDVIYQHKQVIILGAGVSGAAAIDELTNTIGLSKDQIVVIEKRDRIGGKLYSNKSLNAELGGVILMTNYAITDTLSKYKIPVERLFSTNQSSLNQTIFQTENPSIFQQGVFVAKLGWQVMVFAKENFLYKWFPRSPARDVYDMTFREFVEKKNLQEISRFLDLMGAGMGYGDQADRGNYAYKWLNYMGYITLPLLTYGTYLGVRNMVRPHGGYQNVVEHMYEGFDVRLSAAIDAIDRSKGVTLQYHDDTGQRYEITADILVTTMSPYYWPKINNFDLSARERACVDSLSYYEYPVAICKIKGYPTEQYFVPSALKGSGFGHVAFIFTADNRDAPEDGRICQIFINLPQEVRGYSLAEGSEGREAMLNDLRQLGYQDVEVLDHKVWRDYHPIIPRELSLALEQEENNGQLNTVHIGTFKHDSFDYVSSAEVSARQRIQSFYFGKPTLMESLAEIPNEVYRHLKRTFTFFTMPMKEPAQQLPAQQVDEAALSPIGRRGF